MMKRRMIRTTPDDDGWLWPAVAIVVALFLLIHWGKP